MRRAARHTICGGQPVDRDELNFLLQCNKYRGDKNNLFEKLINLCPNFEYLDSNNKLIYMLTAEGETSLLGP